MIAVLQSPGSSSCITASTNEANGRGAERKGFQRERRKGMKREEEDHLSLSSLLAAMVKKSLVGCRTEEDDDLRSMEIGWPTNVQHVAHVTFDRFHGFLGLPVEFEPEIPPRPPSASASVFGVSTESMQCSYDKRGNSVPTILLLMQKRLYDQGGLQAEGIFRINAENGQEELVRDQLNRGIVPDGIDVHCLAGLIKAWFRELPRGVLDSLAPEQVMQCQTEDECAQLVKQLPPVEGALFNWAINLMADVVVAELQNKMNARNIAVVFAPNMTQMDDPLSALVYAVQVMNVLKTLILMTLKQRQEEPVSGALFSSFHDPSNEEGCRHCFLLLDPASNEDIKSSSEKLTLEDHGESRVELVESSCSSSHGESAGQRSRASPKTAKQPKEMKKKSRGITLVSRINSRMERVEAWR